MFKGVLGLVLVCFVSARASTEFYQWIHWLNGTHSVGSSVGIDREGNAYFAGSFTGTLTIGTNQFTSAGEYDFFVAKVNTNGNFVWAMSGGGPGNDTMGRIAVASNGTVFLCGFWFPNAAFGTNTSGSSSNAFVARIDQGVVSWLKPFDADGTVSVADLALSTSQQSLWLVGKSQSRIIVKAFGEDGSALTNFFGSTAATVHPAAIAVGSNGNIYVVGTFASAIDFGATNLNGFFNAQFTVAYNPGGQALWAWTANNGYNNYGYAVTIAPDGSIISGGEVTRTFMGGVPYPYAFAARHRPDGALLWLTTLGEHRGDFRTHDLAVDARGNVIVAGYAHGYRLDLNTRGGAMVAVLKPDGGVIVAHRINSANRDDQNAAYGVACNAAGDVWFTGILNGGPTFGTNALPPRTSGVVNAFLAHRITMQASIETRTQGTNLVLSWPRTAVALTLQESTKPTLFGSWTNTSHAVQNVNGRQQVTVPKTGSLNFFRLFQTN